MLPTLHFLRGIGVDEGGGQMLRRTAAEDRMRGHQTNDAFPLLVRTLVRAVVLLALLAVALASNPEAVHDVVPGLLSLAASHFNGTPSTIQPGCERGHESNGPASGGGTPLPSCGGAICVVDRWAHPRSRPRARARPKDLGLPLDRLPAG
jgi:hypothetical protein